MTKRFHRRHGFAVAATLLSIVALIAACTSSTSGESDANTTAAAGVPPNAVPGVPLPDGSVDDAIAKLDGIVDDLMNSSGIPGMAVAVVHDGETVYAKGFGVREAGKDEQVDADTVFQLASLSKSLSATVVAHEVGAGTVTWETPVVSKLPWFALRDPAVTQMVTVGDLFSHRSGLPDHAGDRLEALGFDRRQVLERLRLEPLDPFRISYAYTNFGLTAAAEAVAAAAGRDWESLSEEVLYKPLEMNSTSSRFVDYEARPNRAVGHVLVDGSYQPEFVRDPDPQSPAGGTSSSVNDVARWLAMVLDNGKLGDVTIAPEDALLPAISPQVVASQPTQPDQRAGFYGHGFNVGTTAAGRTSYSHSGAFALGAATNFVAIPSANVGIVVLSNAAPTGIPETITAEFADLVQFGEVRENWRELYKDAFASMDKPEGSLVGQSPPENPAPAQPLPSYVGTYASEYWGPANITETAGALTLTLGPDNRSFPLKHWDGDTFVFDIQDENAPPGTVSKATFAGGSLTLEFFDENGLGRFIR